MTNDGVGFIDRQPCLVWNGKGAPWSGLFSKFRESHKQKYSDWLYLDDPLPVIILLEGLIRWEDE